MVRDVVAASLTRHLDSALLSKAHVGRAATLVTFSARHQEVGDASVRVAPDQEASAPLAVTVSVGHVLSDYAFIDFDADRPMRERAERLGEQVASFLAELVADRILMWRSRDGVTQGWRGCADSVSREPLVMDNRVYQRYLWSGPLSVWRATDAILGRGEVLNEAECYILRNAVEPSSAPCLTDEELRRATAILGAYDRREGSVE